MSAYVNQWRDEISNLLGMPEASLGDVLDVVAELKADAGDHVECPEWCEDCQQWEWPRSCPPCNGSGCGALTAKGAFDPCPDCAGEGRDHKPAKGGGYK